MIEIDAMIEERAGKPIPRIFAEDGEDRFRTLESECIREAGSKSGKIISTGGGCVTREENYAPLHQNGRILHLVRDIALLPTEGRPLSQKTSPALLWQERKTMYECFADAVIDNNDTVENTLLRIEKELNTL